jgi:hypothetical protein
VRLARGDDRRQRGDAAARRDVAARGRRVAHEISRRTSGAPSAGARPDRRRCPRTCCSPRPGSRPAPSGRGAAGDVRQMRVTRIAAGPDTSRSSAAITSPAGALLEDRLVEARGPERPPRRSLQSVIRRRKRSDEATAASRSRLRRNGAGLERAGRTRAGATVSSAMRAASGVWAVRRTSH